MSVQSMEDLFIETLRDVYHAEKQLLKALPRMAKAASAAKLKRAFEEHRAETEAQVERIEQVFELFGKKARGKPCAAMEGLVEESKEIIAEVEDADVLDAGLISAAQAVEHYEIARYGTLVAWAKQLGQDKAVALLQETLDEEGKTDELLTKLAIANINQKAA